MAAGAFRFRFGQRVRVRPGRADSYATGHILSGQKYPDGRETYAVDIPGGSFYYEGDELEAVDGP